MKSASGNGKLALSEQDKFIACEKVIRAGHETFIEVGNALATIRDERLYREKYKTFEVYCQERWGFTRQHASNVIGSAKTAARISAKTETLSTMVDKNPPPIPNERQARALAPLSEDAQLEAWEEAVETAPEGRVTAKHVEKVVAKKLGKPETPAPTPPELPETAPEPEAATSDPNSLEAVQSDLRAYEKMLRDAARYARDILAMNGQEIKRPWCSRYSVIALIHPVQHVARTILNDMPVGGDPSDPKLHREQVAEEAGK